MKPISILRPLIFITALLALSSFLKAFGQTPGAQGEAKIVRITGVRFAYPLIENWIEKYGKVNPGVQLIIESRGTQDPSQYDILVEAYEQSDEIKRDRDYAYVGRYAILPVANSQSQFAKTYVKKGLTAGQVRQIFFHDIFADKSGQENIVAPFTPYTRMQKSGAPIVFAHYFHFEQKDIAGKGIAGSDEHLLKAVLRDTTAVSFLATPLIYGKSGLPITGLTPIPVDLNDNGRVGDDEKFYTSRSNVIDRLSNTSIKDIHNVPIEYIHLSVDKKSTSAEAIAFIRWIVDNGLTDLKDFGFLPAEPSRIKNF